jgi:hypothetical protein
MADTCTTRDGAGGVEDVPGGDTGAVVVDTPADVLAADRVTVTVRGAAWLPLDVHAASASAVDATTASDAPRRHFPRTALSCPC